jgi:pimeloyl-ACP methyl ester carboxylesterase
VRDVSVEATPQPAASAANQQVMLAVRPDARESMRQALAELVDATRRHDRGVVRFEAGLDPEDDTRVFGYEIWESQQALEEHADCVTGDSGPLVVLLHGFPNTWYAWRQVMAQLARTHSVLAVDPRGLGDSDAGEQPNDVPSGANDLALLLDSIDVGPAFVAGQDWGGSTAFAFAAAHPDAARGLAVVETMPSGPWTEANSKRAGRKGGRHRARASVRPQVLVDGTAVGHPGSGRVGAVEPLQSRP